MFAVTLMSAIADNYTTTTQNNLFSTDIILFITNSTITLISENGSITYPNAYPFNYTYSFSIDRIVNVTNYYFNTINVNSTLTCPAPIVNCTFNYSLSCPETEFNETFMADYMRTYIDTDVKPSQEKIDICSTNLQLCRDDIFMIQQNSTDCESKIGEYKADSKNYKNLYEDARSEKIPYMMMIVSLLIVVAFMISMFLSGGNLNNLMRGKPF